MYISKLWALHDDWISTGPLDLLWAEEDLCQALTGFRDLTDAANALGCPVGRKRPYPFGAAAKKQKQEQRRKRTKTPPAKRPSGFF